MSTEREKPGSFTSIHGLGICANDQPHPCMLVELPQRLGSLRWRPRAEEPEIRLGMKALPS